MYYISLKFENPYLSINGWRLLCFNMNKRLTALKWSVNNCTRLCRIAKIDSLSFFISFSYCQIMNVTSSITETPSVQTNGTSLGAGSAGLAVGLTLFFLLLGIVPGVIVYKCHSKKKKMQLEQDRSPKKEDNAGATQDVLHPYTSMYRGQSAAQTPIYENLTRTAGSNRPAVSQSRCVFSLLNVFSLWGQIQF